MMDKKPDRRTSRTRRQLRDSLLSLVLEKGYDTVTVEEITARADLGRTTFYLHYRDKEELLLESIDSMVDGMVEMFSQLPLSAWKPGLHPEQALHTPIQFIFEHAASHADLYRIILRGEGRSQATERLREIIVRAANRFLEVRLARERPEIHPVIPLEVFANYFAGSLLGIVTWWLENNLPYPPEQMAEMFEMMFFQGAGRGLGMPRQTE
jgi:AcrR family transcriptional regulator